MSIGLALAAALVFGAGDFLGGIATRRTRVLTVVLLSHLIGLGGIAVVAAVVGGVVSGTDLLLGAAGGLAGAAGVAMLYQALASGVMSLVAPITGIVAVIVPVAAGVGLGERPAPLQYAGIAIAVVAVGLLGAGGGSAARLRRSPLLLALGAGVCFGLFYVALARTGGAANLWPIVAARCASVTTLVALSVVLRRRPRLAGVNPLVIIGVGVFDVAANALYQVAVHGGLLSIVAVLVSLYPVSTVVCSLLFLNERLRRGQVAGVAAALAAVVLITT